MAWCLNNIQFFLSVESVIIMTMSRLSPRHAMSLLPSIEIFQIKKEGKKFMKIHCHGFSLECMGNMHQFRSTLALCPVVGLEMLCCHNIYSSFLFLYSCFLFRSICVYIPNYPRTFLTKFVSFLL